MSVSFFEYIDINLFYYIYCFKIEVRVLKVFMSKEIYDFKPLTAEGEEYPLSQFEGKVMLLVNTASKCRFTEQFEALEKLNQDYLEKGLIILAFPTGQFLGQEFKDDEKIQNFCKVRYNTTVTVLKRTKVNGPDAEPLYKYLKKQIAGERGESIEWNFAKFLVDRMGNVVKRYLPKIKPEELREDIEALL